MYNEQKLNIILINFYKFCTKHILIQSILKKITEG